MNREDRWLTIWLALSFLTAFILIGVNAIFFQFSGISYLPKQLILPIFLLLLLMAYNFYAGDHWPRISFAIHYGGFYALSMVALAVLATGVQFTPFPPIDPLLARWDAWLHFNAVDVVRWTNARPLLRSVLNLGYDSINIQLSIVPLVFLLFQDRRAIRVYTHATVYSSLIGFVFYYFFPSSGPASFYSSSVFSAMQRLTFAKFYNAHHFLPVNTILGGMVAFPSLHVAWAVMLAYASSANKWLAYPIGLLNALMIVSTVLLGWHYLVDVPAGIILALASLFLAEKTHCRLCRSGNNDDRK